MISEVPIIVDNDGLVYRDWAAWKAVRSGSGDFRILEVNRRPCGSCGQQGTVMYRTSLFGWARMPCGACFGARELVDRVVVYLREDQTA